MHQLAVIFGASPACRDRPSAHDYIIAAIHPAEAKGFANWDEQGILKTVQCTVLPCESSERIIRANGDQNGRFPYCRCELAAQKRGFGAKHYLCACGAVNIVAAIIFCFAAPLSFRASAALLLQFAKVGNLYNLKTQN